jgi:CheY-like chemotaxis protein
MTRKSKALAALFGARRGILYSTHLEPSRWWSGTELARESDVSLESLADDLAILTLGEILITRNTGNAAEYQANPQSPFFADVQAMMAKAAMRDPGTGTETILVVDDQPATLKVAQILLESFGYKVLSAANAQEAIILFRQHQRQIRLMLTDVVMPDISGPQLAQRLLSIKPDLRVIYMSGYPNDELRDQGVAFLSKPFNPAGLSRAVREALEGE